MLLLASVANAQRGLDCYPVFKGKIVPKNRMIETEVGAGQMSTYKLDYYHSVQFQTDEATAIKIGNLVSADAAVAESANVEKTGELLTYALIQPTPFKKVHRYICYQARPVSAAWVITLLYLEGSATLDDLSTMFDVNIEQ